MQRDFSPLEIKITRSDIVDYKKRNKETTVEIIIRYFSLSLIAILFIAWFSRQITLLYRSNQEYVLPIIIVITVFLPIGLYLHALIEKQRLSKIIKLERFVNNNGLEYISRDTFPRKDGLIFSVGRGHESYDILRATQNGDYEIANHRYTVNSGENSEMIERGYLMIKLNRRLPNMVLDSKKNNVNMFGISISNLPVSFKANQKMSLEGDFDSHFTLYAPSEYKTDALYVFTPDLMALFIDKSGDFDAEIVDDNLYIYSIKPFDLIDVNLTKRLFHIIDTVMAKAVRQSRNYSDSRVGDGTGQLINQISLPGQRLKKHTSLYVVLMAAIIIVIIIVNVYMRR